MSCKPTAVVTTSPTFAAGAVHRPADVWPACAALPPPPAACGSRAEGVCRGSLFGTAHRGRRSATAPSVITMLIARRPIHFQSLYCTQAMHEVSHKRRARARAPADEPWTGQEWGSRKTIRVPTGDARLPRSATGIPPARHPAAGGPPAAGSSGALLPARLRCSGLCARA